MDPQTTEPIPTAPQPVSETPAPTPSPAAPSPQTAAAAEALLPPVPTSWPGGFGVYKYSKQAVKVNTMTIVVVGLIFIILEGIFDKAGGKNGGGSLFSFIVSSLGSVSLASIYLSSIKGEKVGIGDSFKNGFPLWLKAIGLNFLVTISIIVSLILLIVPFFFVMPRLSLATYFLVDRKLGVMDAFKASWNETKGHLTKVWGIIGAAFLMALLMVTIIGIPFSIYFLIMYSAASAVLYQYITKNPATPAATAQPVVPAPAPPATA